MKKTMTWILLCACMLALGTGCAASPYEEEAFLGKTSAEIVEMYGAFDCVSRDPDADGLYRNARCGYTVREKRRGFWDAHPEILFFISFDEDGVAVSCEEGYRPGG